MTKRPIFASVAAAVLLGSPALVEPSLAAATPTKGGWTNVVHGHPANQQSHLFDAWSDGTDVWAAGWRQIDIQGTLEYRTWVERCDTSAGTCEDENTKDIETRPADTRTTAVTGSSATDVWIAGQAKQLSGGIGPIIEHWDGSDWSIVPTPVEIGSLSDLSALSSTDVWAVGTEVIDHRDRPLVLRWDGTTWAREPVEIRGCETGMRLFRIDATGRRPLAMGYCYGQHGSAKYMIISRTAQGWRPDTIDGLGARRHLALQSLAWTGGVAWASAQFGDKWKGTILRRHHRTWSPVATPPGIGIPHGFGGTHAHDAWVVGGRDFDWTTMHWDGTAWNSVPDPGHGVLYATTMTADGTPWAVGDDEFKSVIQRYDGPISSPLHNTYRRVAAR